MSPADAAVAVHSYDRRFHDLLTRRDDEDRADSMLRRKGSSGWSALDHVAFVAAGLAQSAEALRRVLVSDHPQVTVPRVDGEPSSAGDVDQVMAELSGATSALAKVIEGASGDDWNRAGSDRGTDITALAVARNAVHIGIHHLRAAEHVIQEVRGQPG